MRRLAAFLAAVLALAGAADAAPPAPRRPNFLIIVADDLGFSDIGAFGGEIRTPNLDRLAREGVRLTGFHAAPLCSVTRAMLISGTDSRTAGLGAMAESLASNQRGQPGYEGHLSERVAALPEILAADGYRTLFSGKWHLGRDESQDPSRRGFQRSFALLQGSHNHFGLNVATDPSRGFTYREDGRTLDRLPPGFYSSDAFATKLIDQLRAGAATAQDKDKPFLAWLAFSAPHWPLQAPAEDIARYKGRYDAGFEALRAARLARQAALGVLPRGVAAHPPRLARDWALLSDAQRRESARRMEVYAAMVDRLDQNVGRVIAELKRTGIYDDTVILFLSDNGAEGTDINDSALPILKARTAGADNSLANIGSATSSVSYGPGWAQAATAPGWLYKAYETEGGTRTPAILRLPHAAAERIAPVYANVMDVVPTVLQLAGIRPPQGSLAGRPVAPLEGRSWLPYLRRTSARIYPADAAIGAELMGSRALREGDWKITDIGDGRWRLFDLAADPGETRDLAAREPARTARLVAAYERYAKTVGVIPPAGPVFRP